MSRDLPPRRRPSSVAPSEAAPTVDESAASDASPPASLPAPPTPPSTPGQSEWRHGLASVVACSLGVYLMAKGVAPLVSLVTRPRHEVGNAARIDRLCGRPPRATSPDPTAVVDERGDWILADRPESLASVVACLTRNAECDFSAHPVAERAIACVPGQEDFCALERVEVRVCQLYAAPGARAGSVEACGQPPAPPVWLLFANGDYDRTGVALGDACRDELRRWCAWHPRVASGPAR